MTQTSYPFDSQAVTESQYSKLFREFSDTGLLASADAISLSVSADAGGMRVFVQPGSAVVRGFAYDNDAVVQLTIGASTSQARVDRIILKLDPAVNSVVLAVKAGTAGSSSPPSLTQGDTGVYEMTLAKVAVGANVTAISAGDVTDERTFTGAETGIWSTATRPATARLGKLGYNLTSGLWEYWSGAEWSPLVPNLPVGAIMAYGGADVPSGWHLCDGTAHGSSVLQAVIGSANTPDLRSRFIVGAGQGAGLSNYTAGATGGAEAVTLTSAQSGLPAHSHSTTTSTDSRSHSHTWSNGTAASNGSHAHGGGYVGNFMIQGSDSTNNSIWFVTQTVETLYNTYNSAGSHSHTVTGTIGSYTDTHSHTVTVNNNSAANASQSHENRPPYIALRYIIKKA